MGKSDEKQTKNKAHNKATDNGESKHKNKPSFDATKFEATDNDPDNEGARNSQWLDRFRQLCEYKVEFGHCRVPNRYSANPTLGAWVCYQRKTYKEGKPASMTPEHIRALNGIGFDWGTSRTELASIWSVRFQQLCEFKAQFGDCLVPIKYSANPKLGRWVMNQCYRYRLYQEGKPSCITAEHIRALDGIDFIRGRTSKIELAAMWRGRFQQLCEFKAQFGHCLVPFKYSANLALGYWVSKQRSNYRLHREGKRSPMTMERIRELERIEFKWKRTATPFGGEQSAV
jgi:hypothetical protein